MTEEQIESLRKLLARNRHTVWWNNQGWQQLTGEVIESNNEMKAYLAFTNGECIDLFNVPAEDLFITSQPVSFDKELENAPVV